MSEHYTRLQKEQVAMHQGVFRRKISTFEAIALIVSGTIGAGVLGIPYAVAQVGIPIGIAYILVIGALSVGLNLLLGEILVRTRESFQLSGLAGKYLGSWGKAMMTLVVYTALLGILTVYIIGSGQVLFALFGWDPFHWGVVFFVVGSLLVVAGLRTVAVVEFLLTLMILGVVLFIAAWAFPHIESQHVAYTNMAALFLPYGVILFAYSGTTVVPEAYHIMKKEKAGFERAIIAAGFITALVYMVFAFVVVGVTGAGTTEIATIGLGETLGRSMSIFGNIFALLAMGTSYIVIGSALRDSLHWDFKFSKAISNIATLGIPFLLFIFGVRQFIAAVDFVGGVLISIQMLLIIMIYWRAKHLGDVPPGKYKLHHTLLLAAILVVAFTVGAVHSMIKLFT